MTARIPTYLQRFRRRTFPASNETSGYHFDATMAKLDAAMAKVEGLEALLERVAERQVAKLNELERLIPNIDGKLAALEELDYRLDRSFAEINRKLEKVHRQHSDLEFLLTVAPTQVTALLGPIARSKAQLRQDIFVLTELEQKRNGVFVEFGATDGLDLSNTWLLEKEYGWNGILAEPAKCWHAALRENRSSAIEPKCVWRNSGEILEFSETESPEYSTLEPYVSNDMNSEMRKKANHYLVETISLTDLLEKYQAPREIDYLSIDTEGSEFDILEDFDFDKYRFNVITCEHNFASTRERLHDLLQAKGYRRKFEELSQWDDWYVRSRD